MIDIHCHILPGFDDGSESIRESLAMARMAASSGVTEIVVTPHFSGESVSLRKLPDLLERYDALTQAVQKEGIPLKLHPGAEILCLPETPRLAARGALPTLGDTSYFLAEFYFNESPNYMSSMLHALKDTGYIPVVAHPERYKAVQQSPRLLQHWFEQGYVLQLNKGSLIGSFGSRVQTTAAQALDMGLAHIIASDGHSATRRTPHMGSLLSWLSGRCDPAYIEVLTQRNPARLISGQEMEHIG